MHKAPLLLLLLLAAYLSSLAEAKILDFDTTSDKQGQVFHHSHREAMFGSGEGSASIEIEGEFDEMAGVMKIRLEMLRLMVGDENEMRELCVC